MSFVLGLSHCDLLAFFLSFWIWHLHFTSLYSILQLDCFINANQIVIPLHQTQQRLSFVLRLKSRFLTLIYEGLYVLVPSTPTSPAFYTHFCHTVVLDVSLFLYQVSAQKAFLTFHPVSLLKEGSDPRRLGFDPLLCFSLEPCASPVTMGPMLL